MGDLWYFLFGLGVAYLFANAIRMTVDEVRPRPTWLSAHLWSSGLLLLMATAHFFVNRWPKLDIAFTVAEVLCLGRVIYLIRRHTRELR